MASHIAHEDAILSVDIGNTICRATVAQYVGDTIVMKRIFTFLSVVGISEQGEVLVGEAAWTRAHLQNTIFDLMRLVGRPWKDPTLLADMKRWPFQLVEGEDGMPRFQVHWARRIENVSIPRVVSRLLAHAKALAEAELGFAVTKAILTVPFGFNHIQRLVMKQAGERAGLNVIRLMNEPDAAAIEFSLRDPSHAEREVLMISFGDSFLSVCSVTIEAANVNAKRAVSCMNIGGMDFDLRLVSHCVSEFHRLHNRDVSHNKGALHKLRMACNVAKHTLSTQLFADIVITDLCEGIGFQLRIQRETFEALCKDLFVGIFSSLESCRPTDEDGKIGSFLLLGGSLNIPCARRILERVFPGRGLLTQPLCSAECVVTAARSYGLKLITCSFPCPVLGDALIVPITSYGYSLKLYNDDCAPIVPPFRELPSAPALPWARCGVFTTVEDNQGRMLLTIREMDCPAATDMFFEILGIPPQPRGVPKLQVTLDVNTDGMVSQVRALDLLTRHNLRTREATEAAIQHGDAGCGVAYFVPSEAAADPFEQAVQLMGQGQYYAAATLLDSAIVNNPSDVRLFAKRSECRFEVCEFALAVEDGQQCLRLNSKYLKGYVLVGRALQKLGDFLQAFAIAQRGLGVNPRDPELLDFVNGLAAARKEEGTACILARQYETAIQKYTEAMKYNPKDPTFFTNRSLCFAALGRFREAADDGDRAIQLAPTFAKGYYRAAVAYASLDDPTTALQLCNRGLSFDAADKNLQKLEQQLVSSPLKRSGPASASPSTASPAAGGGIQQWQRRFLTLVDELPAARTRALQVTAIRNQLSAAKLVKNYTKVAELGVQLTELEASGEQYFSERAQLIADLSQRCDELMETDRYEELGVVSALLERCRALD